MAVRPMLAFWAEEHPALALSSAAVSPHAPLSVFVKAAAKTDVEDLGRRDVVVPFPVISSTSIFILPFRLSLPSRLSNDYLPPLWAEYQTDIRFL